MNKILKIITFLFPIIIGGMGWLIVRMFSIPLMEQRSIIRKIDEILHYRADILGNPNDDANSVK